MSSLPTITNLDLSLTLAVRENDETKARRLLALGTCNHLDSMVLMACRHSVSAGILEALLAHGGQANTADPEMWGTAPLHEAAAQGRADLVRLLLAHGANPNQETDTCETPLSEALTADVVQALVEGGAELNVRDRQGNVPIARMKSREALVAALDLGADPFMLSAWPRVGYIGTNPECLVEIEVAQQRMLAAARRDQLASMARPTAREPGLARRAM